MVSNFSSYTTPKITRTILTMGKILNPHGIFEITPLLSLGGVVAMEVLQTWRNRGKPISDMSVKALTPQQDKAQTPNLENAPKFADGNHISTKSLAEFKTEKSDKFSELLVTSWEAAKLESPVYKKVELAFLTANKEPTGLFTKKSLGSTLVIRASLY